MDLDFADAPRPVRLALLSGRGHYQEVISAVLSARTSVWIGTANLKELYVESRPGLGRRRGRGGYHSVVSDLVALAHRGVELRILHARAPSQAFVAELKRQKPPPAMELRMCPRVHLKAVIIDGQYLYLGSANWTGAGLGAKGEGRRNFELGVWTEDEATLDRVQSVYDEIWRGRACQDCKLREVCPKPLDGGAGAKPLKKTKRVPAARKRTPTARRRT